MVFDVGLRLEEPPPRLLLQTNLHDFVLAADLTDNALREDGTWRVPD